MMAAKHLDEAGTRGYSAQMSLGSDKGRAGSARVRDQVRNGPPQIPAHLPYQLQLGS